MNQTVLSVQSCVSYGHVGNSAIMFPLQRLGVRVWPIHTVFFSNHTGYKHWRGRIFDIDAVRDVFLGIKERGVLKDCDILLTGYMGSNQLGEVMLEILSELKTIRPDLIYCCDPVMGDFGRNFFVSDGIPEFFKKKMICNATIITPNHFELEFLCGEKFDTMEGAIEAVYKVMQMGPKVVLVTSLLLKNTPDNLVNMLVVDSHSVYKITTPYLPVTLNGTGDLTAALFTHYYVKFNHDIARALEETTSRIFSVIENTYNASSSELTILESQDLIFEPKHIFKVKSVEIK